jgi:hypothetical protein
MTLEAEGDRTPSLPSKLGPDSENRYRLVWYPDACEAFVSRSSRGGGQTGSPVLDIRTQLDDDEDPEDGRSKRSLRRSRGTIRRYAVANRCNVLISPTYDDEHLDRATDRQAVELDVRNAVRRLRGAWGERFPYVSMPEMMPERSEREGVPVYNGMIITPRMPRAVFDALIESWPYGRGDGYNGVDVTQWRQKRGGAQYASKALTKYAGKQLGEAPRGKQAYRVGQGFQPERREMEGIEGRTGSAGEVLEVWAEQVERVELEKLIEVENDEGLYVDAAWGMW